MGDAMLNRRDFLTRTLQASSLLAIGSVVPQFLVNTARAAEVGKDTVLVVLEMTGGNDGLNMVIPYGDDLYHKARPTLRYTKDQVIKIDDHIGLHPALRPLDQLLKNNQLAVVQGIGYPNPDRSHFESMDRWHSADPSLKTKTGWMARGSTELQGQSGGVPGIQIGPEKLPLALRGAPSGVASIRDEKSFKIDLGTHDPKAHQKLLDTLSQPDKSDKDSLLSFVQRRQVQTYTTIDRLKKVLAKLAPQGQFPQNSLGSKMELIGHLIANDFGTRLFYVAIDGFDTHSGQREAHQRLFTDVSTAIASLFQRLQQTGHDKRVLVMTFSEFGRRVAENNTGTDHGAGSCLFVAGPGVKGGLVGKHPSLKDLDNGDLKHHTDFRKLYATLLDGWLGCGSKAVLGEKFDRIPLLKAKA
jgi:uncharacterized protein (DUF1501 family)